MRRIDSRVSYKQGYPGASVPAELGCVVGGRRRVNKYVVCARACARGPGLRAGVQEQARRRCVYILIAPVPRLYSVKKYIERRIIRSQLRSRAPHAARPPLLVSVLSIAHTPRRSPFRVSPRALRCVFALHGLLAQAHARAAATVSLLIAYAICHARSNAAAPPNAPLSVLRSASSLRLPRGRPPSAFNRHVAFRCLMLMPRFRSWACPRSLGAVLSRVASQAHGAAAASAEHPAHKISTARSGPRPPLALGWRGRARRQPGHLPSGSASGYASMKPNVWIMSSRPKR